MANVDATLAVLNEIDSNLSSALGALEQDVFNLDLDLDLGTSFKQVAENQQAALAFQQEAEAKAMRQMQKADAVRRSTVSTGTSISAPSRIRNRV